jgi:hypothetical protein
MDHQARVFVPGKPFQPSVMLHSNFLGPLVSYEEITFYEYGPGVVFVTLNFLHKL